MGLCFISGTGKPNGVDKLSGLLAPVYAWPSWHALIWLIIGTQASLPSVALQQMVLNWRPSENEDIYLMIYKSSKMTIMK